MAKLKKYAKAYNIDVAGIIEKDEFINKLIAARVSVYFRGPVSFPSAIVLARKIPRPQSLTTAVLLAVFGSC